MFIVETGDQNVGWVGEKILDILLCNTRTGFSDRNSGPKLCAVSIANDGMSQHMFWMRNKKNYHQILQSSAGKEPSNMLHRDI